MNKLDLQENTQQSGEIFFPFMSFPGRFGVPGGIIPHVPILSCFGFLYPFPPEVPSSYIFLLWKYRQ